MPVEGSIVEHHAAPMEIQSKARELEDIARWLQEQQDVFSDLAATIRIVSQRLSELARKELERRRFIAEVNRAYEALRADNEAWSEELRERQEWDCSLLDGLDSETE